ncbi:MAG TPA: hypothetical protein VMT99_04225 [Candidatus Paceibacterota bacterium]|nr:hypothetical protein [Candidatus Paceibacterota bacterium]
MDSSSTFGRYGFLWFGAGLVLALAGIAWFVTANSHPAPQVALSLTAPSQVAVGQPFAVTVSASNPSAQALAGTQLSVVVPDGFSFVGAPSGTRAQEVSLGTLAPGASTSTAMNLVAIGTTNTVGQVKAAITYGLAGNENAQFEKDAQTDVIVGGAVLSVAVNAPQAVFSGQTFAVTVTYLNQGTDTVPDAQFVMDFPAAFAFTSSSALFTSNGASVGGTRRTWDLGAIAPAASGTFTISGSLNGPAGASYALAGALNGVLNGSSFPIQSQTVTVAVAQSPLEIGITLNNSSTYVASAGDELNYELTYANNSSVSFQNVMITAKLTGSMYDFSKLKTNGSFNSVNDTITWTVASVPGLASVAPGQGGTIDFSVNAKSAYPIRLVSDKNFTLKALATITSPTLPPNTPLGSNTQSIVQLATKVGGAVTLGASAYRRDPLGIANTGPYPPRVNQSSTYTVHWKITNYATDLSNVVVSAYLQSGSTFTGVASSTVPSSTPQYDSATGLVTWTLPALQATAGILTPAPEAVFQVSNTPAVNEVGQRVLLMSETSLVATDTFTGEPVAAQADVITTDLPDDASLGSVLNKAVSP